MSQAYYRKWRPKTWDQVMGQEHVVTTLRNAVHADRVAHAYLFAGPRGTGKTTSARLLAKAVNCLAEDSAERPCNQCDHCQAVNQGRFLDLIEIDAASNTGVDDVRDLREKINFSPNQGRFKVYIIDEVHMLSTQAFNALLKTLEEPPGHAIFILATTEIHKIPATVLSRCQRHAFRSLPVVDIIGNLNTIVEQEEISVDSEALKLIARQATGSLRDAISLLDQLASASHQITLEMAETVLGTATAQSVIEIVDAIISRDSAVGLDQIHLALDAGSSPRQFARQIVNYLRSLLLVRMGNADQIFVSTDSRAQMAAHAQAFDTPELMRIIRAFNQAAGNAHQAWQPALPLEMAFVEALDYPEVIIDKPAKVAVKPKPAAPQSAAPPPKEESPAPQGDTAPVETVSADSLPDAISKNWDRILTLVRDENPSTQALLNSCKPLGMRGSSLVLGFNGEFAKSKMEQGDNFKIFHQVMEKVLGETMDVICIVTQGGEMPSNIDQDGMVATALRDLGGEIVDVQ
ncbi:MAG: DNA polymerase III subunit gamma/tau [Chloroflexota bacterium]